MKKKRATKKAATKSKKRPVAAADAPIIPRHLWTHDGSEVLILKCVAKDGKTYGNFQWPLTVGAEIAAPDFTTVAECGGGLHGWPWGFSIGDGKEPDWAATWLVFGALPADVIDLGGKVKTRTATIRYVGDWMGASAFVLAGQIAWVHQAARGAASATGWSGAASATGWSGAASATGGRGAASATGARGAASATGWSGAASATGWRGAASATGERGAASATGGRGVASATGWRGAASATGASGAASATGESSLAGVTGLYGKAQAGPFGVIALAWWNRSAARSEMRCAEVGIGDGSDGKLKAKTWYRLNDETGAFKEA